MPWMKLGEKGPTYAKGAFPRKREKGKRTDGLERGKRRKGGRRLLEKVH